MLQPSFASQNDIMCLVLPYPIDPRGLRVTRNAYFSTSANELLFMTLCDIIKCDILTNDRQTDMKSEIDV